MFKLHCHVIEFFFLNKWHFVVLFLKMLRERGLIFSGDFEFF